MHSSLAVTTAGKPLGLTAVKFWTRKKFKGTNALKGRGKESGKHSVNTTRIPIEQKESIRWLENLDQSTQLVNPDRCIHIGDRESDIYELFCLAEEKNTHFLVRTCVDRLAGTGKTAIARKMKRDPIQGMHHVETLDAKLAEQLGKPSFQTLVGKFTFLNLSLDPAFHGFGPRRNRTLTSNARTQQSD
jgi:hypothetical protein